MGIWTWPLHGLAQAGAVTVIGVAVAEFVAPGMFGPVAAVLAAEAVLVGVAATVRIRVEWAGVSAVLFGGAYAALAAWRDWSPEMVIVVTGAVAGVLVVPAMVLWLRGVGGRVGIWTWPLHGLAQAGAITVASVAGEVAGYDAAGIVAAVLLAEAVLAAIAAIVRVHVGWATGAAALLAAAYAGLGIWQRWTPTTLIAITGAVAGGLAVVATVGLLSGRLRPRGVIWIWPMHGLAQLGVVTILIAGFDRLPQVEFLGVLAAVSVGEALLVGLAAGITGRSGLAAAATGLVGIAYTAFVGWMQWPDTVIAAVTAPTSVVVGAFAVTAWLFANRIRIRIWVAWLHLLAQIGILSSGLVLSPDAATSTQLWVWALICAGEAALAALAASRLPEWPLRPLSVLAALGAGALGLAAAGDGPLGLPLSALLLITAGAIAVGAAVRPEPATASALWTLAGGFAAESLLFTTATFGADSLQVATVLGIAGAALAMLGVGTGRWGFLQGGLLLWLGPIAIVGNRFGAGRPHPYVVGAAVVLLIVIEIERIRRRAADRPMPEQLHLAEWAFLVVPMGLAALDTIDRSMAYALLLGVEAAVVLLWSLATEVRRRLLVGTAGLTIAVLLPVAISVAQSAEGGFASGTWLSIGAVAAVCFILIGSLLEKNRVRLGRMVSRISHSLEGWE